MANVKVLYLKINDFVEVFNMVKVVKITLDNFNNSKSSSANVVLLSRLEKAMNEEDDFPFYVEFEVLGGISQMRSMIIRFVPKPEVNDKMKDCEEDDEMIKYVTAESHEKDLDDIYEELDALKDKVGDIEAQQGLDFQKQLIKGLRGHVDTDLVDRLDHNSANIDILRNRVDIQSDDMDELLDKIDINTNDIRDLKAAISRLEKQQYETMRKVNKFEEKSVSSSNDLILDTYHTVLGNLIKRVDGLESDAANSAQETEAVDNTISNLIKRVDALESAYKNNFHDIEAVDRTVCRLKDRIEAVDRTVQRLTDRLEPLSNIIKKVDELEHDIDNLEQNVSINTLNIGDNRDVINKLAAKTDERFEKCHTDKHSINDNIKRLDDILYALNVRVSVLERKILE